MKILVTGSKGFIGQRVCAELIARGHEPVGFDLPEHNVANLSTFRNVTRMTDLGGVINLAGMLGTPELFGHEFAAAEINILGALNVYDVAGKLGVPVVQIGTGHKGQPNPYAITKACAEDLGMARAQWTGQEIAVVRAFHVYGPGQAVGPPYGKSAVHKFFPTFATRALMGDTLEVCGYTQSLIDPVYVDDAARVLVDAINGPYGEVLEAGCGKALSVKQVALDIARAAGNPGAEIVRVPQRTGEPEYATVVADEPLCFNEWPYMVPETVEWYRQWLTANL